MDARRRNLLKLGVLANTFEWYEFSVVGFLAGTIGELFFSTQQPLSAVIKGFMVFAMSYLIRPLGGLFFGIIGDRFGNQWTLKLSLVLTAIPTVLIGILPTYKDVGLISTVLLVLLRLTQGFAMAGELPSSARYVFEHAKSSEKSMLCSIAMSSSTMGVLLASCVISGLTYTVDKVTLLNWAWRIPFLLSIPLTWFIILIRQSLIQSPRPIPTSEILLPDNQATLMKRLMQGILLISFGTVCFYTYIVWMPSYLHYFLDIPFSSAQFINTLSLLITLPTYPLVGYLSHRWGYHNMILSGLSMTLILVVPIFSCIVRTSNFVTLFGLQVTLMLLFILVNAVTIEMLMKLFPFSKRSLGVSLAWSLPGSFIGGTTPMLYNYVLSRHDYLLFPAFYIIFFGILALPIALKLNSNYSEEMPLA